MMNKSKRWGIVAIAALAAALLAGCATASPQATSAPTKPSTSVPEATPTPSESAAAVSDVVVTATAIEVRNDQGELVSSYDYFQPTEQLVEGLTAAFGSAPVTTPVEAGLETPAGSFHDWGGFRLFDTDRAGEPPHTTNHFVIVTSALENDVSISTVDGIAVGDNAAALEEAYPDASNRITVTGQSERLDIFVDSSPLPERPAGSSESYSVWLIAPDPSGAITEFRAPSPNFGV